MRNRDELLTSGTPGAPQARARRFPVGLAAAALLLAGVLPLTSADAQKRGNRAINTLEVDDARGPAVQRPSRTGFNLFAEEDLAQTGMRMTGTNGWSVPNVGPCPFYYPNNNDPQTCALTITPNSQNFGSESFFEIGLIAGAPISEFRKIRAVYPGVNNMRPPLGYTTPYTAYLAAPFSRRWGPGDGQFGNLFAGATSTADGSCLDHTSYLSGAMPTGFPLTAGSDCQPTWASTGFDGRFVPRVDSLLARATENPAAFSWDEWKMPNTVFDTSRFRGDFSTYGTISDSYREILQRFGAVTPRGVGPSSERGYPLGLDIRYDAFQFSRPSVRNVVYYQVTLVNNSARVYGTGIDYDSLYVGIQPGLLFGGNNGQGAEAYEDFSRNAVIMAGGGISGTPCSATHPPKQVAQFGSGCFNTAGFNNGGQAFIFLKSPLGDMRNKLFTRPTSPFSRVAGVPANILDDTITFNQLRVGGFGSNYNASTARNDKALFGWIAGIEDVFLDGRSITNTADFSAFNVFSLFQSEGWRGFTGTITPDLGRFPRFVPGSTNQPNTAQHPNPGQRYGEWDYNNDGIQDTIKVPGCGSQGCADVYGDTLPSGMVAWMRNVGNVVAAGPFKLAAGDTTELLVAFVGAGDRGTFEAQMNAAIENYLNFYAGPAPVPPPTFEPEDIDIVPATVRDTTVGAANTLIRLRIDRAVNDTDKFVFNVYETIRTSTDPNIVRVRSLNPGLLEAIEERITRNYSELLIFKSCDRGANFTTSSQGVGDCTPAPARNTFGQPIGFGWQPWARIPIDPATGQPVVSFVTDVVRSGRTYLYSAVTRTRGLIDIPIIDSVTVNGVKVLRGTNLAAALNIDADTIGSPLARSGPSTVIAYAPISLPAGVTTATLDTATVLGDATTRVTAAAIGTTQSGRYRVVFANRFIVTTQIGDVPTGAQTTVIAQRVIKRGAVGNGAAQDTIVAQADTFTGPGRLVTDGEVTIPSNLVGTANGITTYRDIVDLTDATQPGYLIARAGTSTQPLYLSTVSRSTASVNAGTTLAFRESPTFPGFTLNFELPTATASTPRFSGTLRAADDTLNAGVVANNGVVLLPAQSTINANRTGGRYSFRYSDDAFGPNAPFRYTTPEQLQADVNASLAARNDVSTTDTTDATRTILTSAGVSLTARPLIAARLPFTVVDAEGQPVTLAMIRRNMGTSDSLVANSRLFGNGGDTVRVQVPALQWLPGDTLYAIETVTRDSTTGSGATLTTILKDTTINGRAARIPIRVQAPAFVGRVVLGCAGSTTPATTAAPRCNPLVPGTFAATGYLPYKNGWTYIAEFARPFGLFSELAVDATGISTVGVQLADNDLSQVRVVPNPYIVQSNLDEITGNRVGIGRVMFTNVPLQGMLRIYSVSGQLMQQLSWTEGDLTNTNTGTVSGDLPFTLRTREGLDMGSGLYLYVLSATGPGANGKVARGKFVIIR